jgi:hypothetical protein
MSDDNWETRHRASPVCEIRERAATVVKLFRDAAPNLIVPI